MLSSGVFSSIQGLHYKLKAFALIDAGPDKERQPDAGRRTRDAGRRMLDAGRRPPDAGRPTLDALDAGRRTPGLDSWSVSGRLISILGGALGDQGTPWAPGYRGVVLYGAQS
jgi:hypothetical protein